MSAATIDPGLSCWRLLDGRILISDFVKTHFQILSFLKPAEATLFQGPCPVA